MRTKTVEYSFPSSSNSRSSGIPGATVNGCYTVEIYDSDTDCNDAVQFRATRKEAMQVAHSDYPGVQWSPRFMTYRSDWLDDIDFVS